MADNDEITRNKVKEVKAKMRATVRRYDNSFKIRFYVEECMMRHGLKELISVTIILIL